MMQECSSSLLSVSVYDFLFLRLGISKMAMLPKSCIFIMSLNLSAGLPFSMRWYSPFG